MGGSTHPFELYNLTPRSQMSVHCPPGTWPLFTRADLTWPGSDQIAHDYDAEMVSHQSERGKEQIQATRDSTAFTNY